MFVRSGSVWTEQARVVGSHIDNQDRFGSSVSLDGDALAAGARNAGPGAGAVAVQGDRLLVGASADDDGGTDSGCVYHFARSAGSWSEQGKLAAGDAAGGDAFGTALALSGDALLVGAPGDGDGEELAAGSDPLDPLSTPAVPQVPIPPWAHWLVAAGLLGLGRAARPVGLRRSGASARGGAWTGRGRAPRR